MKDMNEMMSFHYILGARQSVYGPDGVFNFRFTVQTDDSIIIIWSLFQGPNGDVGVWFRSRQYPVPIGGTETPNEESAVVEHALNL